MIDTIYVQAASKKSLNMSLSLGADIQGEVFKMFEHSYVALNDCADGTVVKIWSARDPSGTPIAKSYGNIKHVKGKVTVV